MQQCRKHLQRQVNPFDVAGLAAEKEELEKKMGAPDFWDDVEAANKANQRMKTISAKLEKYNKLRGLLEDAEVMADMAEEGDDQEMADELIKDMPHLESKVEALKLETLLKGPYDRLNAILSLHAGAGGTEAQDWVSILYRMYTRYCESKGWTVRELDYLAGDEAGIKSVTFEVEGDNAYGYLKAEKGVHRLVRISPFDAFGKRHTSFASLDVTPIFEEDTSEIEINPDDIRIDTYRSGGAGGPHVNKTESAIRITHLPTGTVVECQDERSQHKNRERAMKILRSKLYEAEQEKQNAAIAATRKSQVGTGDRSGKIRTYNFPQNRVTDHRLTGDNKNFNIAAIINGDLDGMIDALTLNDQAQRLQEGKES